MLSVFGTWLSGQCRVARFGFCGWHELLPRYAFASIIVRLARFAQAVSGAVDADSVFGRVVDNFAVSHSSPFIPTNENVPVALCHTIVGDAKPIPAWYDEAVRRREVRQC